MSDNGEKSEKQLILNLPGEITKVGLTLVEGLPIEEWLTIGEQLRRIEGSIQWWLGDWLNYGKRKYGEKYSQGLDVTDYAYDTLRHAAWVADAIQMCRRLHSLSWSHHHEVAALQPENQEKWLNEAEANEWSVHELRARIQESRRQLPSTVKTPGFPDGPFRTVVIDPPWPIEKIAFDRRPVEKLGMDYSTTSLEKISALPIPRLSDPDGTHVYLWVTHHFLPEGLQLFEAWGVRYECLLTWIKPTAQPLWWRFLTEHVLFGKIGSLSPLQKGEAVCFNAPQQRHSHKPDEFFGLVRKVSPKPRLTMFDGPREGFLSWGVDHAI